MLEDAFAKALAAETTVVIDVKADRDCPTPVYDFAAAKATWSYHD
jgi:thiamine pyrophosphate-dependent acetolactate synthase large subunit-like protein